MSVEVGGNTGSCNRAGTLTFHGMTGDVSVKVTADQQGNFVARVTIPKGTFPRAYELELTVDCNGQLQQAQAELTVLNLAPVAADDSANTTPDTPVTIDVTANDSDPDGDDGYPTRVLESSPPTHGTTEVQSDQTIVYTPEKGFVGQDRFQYSICDDIINAAGSADCGTATVAVRTSPTACVPSGGDTPRLQVAPGKGSGGAKLQITATVDRRLVTCPLRLLLGGTSLGPDVPVGSDGSISAERGVPKDAKRGLSSVRLASMSDQTLAQAPFEIVPPPLSPLLKLLIGAGALLAGALARAVFRRWRAPKEERAQHELDPPPEDIRVESHTSPVQVTVEPNRDHTRTFTVRLEPHHDPGIQTMQEATP
jgi:Big-like domain-containing protein